MTGPERDAEAASMGLPPFDAAPVPPPLHPGYRVGRASGHHLSEAERLEYSIFVELEYCRPSSELRSMEYEPWRSESVFQVVVDDQDSVVGTVRTLFGEYDHLPVGKFERTHELPADPVLEYASLADPPGHRAQGVAEELYRAVFQDAVRLGAAGLVALGERWILDFLNGTYGLGFRQLGPSRWYMGGDCFPMGVGLSDLIRRLARSQPSFLQYLTTEIDLRDATHVDVRHTLLEAGTPT